MGHCRSSDQKRIEAGHLDDKGSQSESSQDNRQGDPDSATSHNRPHPCPAPKKPCPNDDTPSGDNLYILKNCDHCADFTIGPCKKCRCPRRPECSGQCKPMHKPVSQESMSPEERTSVETSASAPAMEPSRHVGGNCGPQVCQVCRQQEVTDQGTCMCTQCNAKIQQAVDEVYEQCQGQCQRGVQPGQQGGQWQQQQPLQQQQFNQGGLLANDKNGLPYNIIVVQDCDNQAFMDQLTSAIARGGPQMGGPQMGGPQMGAPQRWNPPNGGFQNVGGVVDYQYIDMNARGGYDNPRDGGYDYGYDMGQAPMEPYMSGKKTSKESNLWVKEAFVFQIMTTGIQDATLEVPGHADAIATLVREGRNRTSFRLGDEMRTPRPVLATARYAARDSRRRKS